MAIQSRRGLKKDFDPHKMLPGEWGVAIDTDTQNQIVWMCFAPGVVKRMGTLEDFKQQIDEILAPYERQREQDLTEIRTMHTEVTDDTQIVIENTDIAIDNAEISEAWAVGKKKGVPVESTDEQYENNAKYWSDKSKEYAKDAEAIVGIDIATLEKAGIVKPNGESISVRTDGTLDLEWETKNIDFDTWE